MKLKIEIDCDNAAFEETELFPELTRILRRLTDRQFGSDLEVYGDSLVLRDANGNKVGYAEFILRDANGNKVGYAEFINVD